VDEFKISQGGGCGNASENCPRRHACEGLMGLRTVITQELLQPPELRVRCSSLVHQLDFLRELALKVVYCHSIQWSEINDRGGLLDDVLCRAFDECGDPIMIAHGTQAL
jgi:hypothetical protein